MRAGMGHYERGKKRFDLTSLAVMGMLTAVGADAPLYFLHGFSRGWMHLVASAGIGCLFGLVLGVLVRNQPETRRMRIHYAAGGVLPGYIAGACLSLTSGGWNGVWGALAVALYYGLHLAPWVQRKQQQGRYHYYSGEGVWLSAIGATMSLAGSKMAGRWIHSMALQGWVPALATWAVAMFVLALWGWLAFVWVGLVLAANRRVPAFGAILAMMGGTQIFWTGIMASVWFRHESIMWSGLAVGLLVMALSITTLFYPGVHASLGTMIIVLSVLSFAGAAGGLVIGGVLGIVGGALVASWHCVMERDGDIALRNGYGRWDGKNGRESMRG